MKYTYWHFAIWRIGCFGWIIGDTVGPNGYAGGVANTSTSKTSTKETGSESSVLLTRWFFSSEIMGLLANTYYTKAKPNPLVPKRPMMSDVRCSVQPLLVYYAQRPALPQFLLSFAIALHLRQTFCCPFSVTVIFFTRAYGQFSKW